MQLIIIHSGIFLGVTLSQVVPLFFETCTKPSSEPVQIKPGSKADSVAANIVP